MGRIAMKSFPSRTMPAFIIIVVLSGFGCDRQLDQNQTKNAPPKIGFDPQSREKTYLWITDRASAVRLDYLTAKKAAEADQPDPRPLGSFLKYTLPSYVSLLEGLCGSEVVWEIKVLRMRPGNASVVLDGF